MALAPKKPDEPIEIIYDSSTGKKYEKGKFLGKGGFAKCFELKDLVTGGIFAGKIVSKSLLVKDHQKEKMEQEIRIHRSLDHKHIVSFHSFFDDKDNVYITLELCSRRSLMELHRRRKTVTEPETRYFMKQILEACTYLHDNKVIHRDLKLGNLFLNDEMEIKLGDFGLATKLEFDGERKRTLCGTPNYIAPEVLTKKGHSFEVDVWSIGCIMYTLLLGKPPFETSNLKDTYERIKKNEYIIPPGKLSASAAALIKKMLRAEPSSRPTVHKILEDEFFIDGICPSRLPTSCLTTAPRYDQLAPVPGTRRPLVNVSNTGVAGTSVQLLPQHAATYSKKDDRAKATTAAPGSAPLAQYDGGIQSDQPTDYYIGELHSIISALLAARPADLAVIREDESEDPASVPIYWVAKWVDYSDKYGLGYQLCDNSVGVLYNDSTRLLLGSNGDNLQYIERDGTEHLHLLRAAPESLTKKVTLLKYFRNYMSEHLLKAGANIVPREGDEMSRLPFLRTWFRTRSAIVIHLSNGTLQINFFQDHTKIIICPLMQAFTYIDEHKRFRTYKMDLVAKYGCSKDIATRLKYALAMVERILQSKSSGGMLRVATAPAAGASGPASDVACH